MGSSLSLPTARILAPTSFAINVAAQVWGMLSSPNMKEISDANPSAFSPQPMMIAYFFGPQQILQVYWLYKLWTERPDEGDREKLKFAGTYALHNKMFVASQTMVTINTVAQLLYYTLHLPPLNQQNWPTYVNATSFAGIGVLDFLHNGAVAFFPRAAPTSLTQVLTGLGFAAGVLSSDPIMGGCLAYNLFAIYLGQRGPWKNLLGWYAVGAGAIVGYKIVTRSRSN